MPRNKEFDYDEKLKTARNVFWKRGYNATSMNDLVDAMQINRSSLYLTYGNKHDLFLKSLGDYIQQKDLQYRMASEKDNDPLQAVKNIIRSVFESAVAEGNCLFTNTVFELASSDKDVANMLQKQTLKAVDFLEQLLTEAQANGTLTTSKSPRSLAHFLVSGLTSIYNTHILFSDVQLTKQTTEILLDILD